jgi:exopolysaccharide biosynthesis protein
VVHEGALALTIDSNGDLGYLSYTDTAGKAQSLIANGIVSAVCGFFPLIDNYEKCTIPDVAGTDVPGWANAQRQIVGQYENGDYCIITGEGRDFASSVGFSIERAQDICKRLGLRFAYNCDGGGSTQTVLGTKNINHVYETPTGRKVKSYIVFNGSSQYAIPNA